MTAQARPRVLVVDDEPLVARAMERLLAPDYQVTLAGSVDEALAQVRGGLVFEAILCDLSMPRRSGGELYAELHAWSPQLASRVVFVTGGAVSREAGALLERTSQPRLDKPFTAEQLLETVARVVARP